MDQNSFASFDSNFDGREAPHGISIDITHHDDDDEEDNDQELEFVEGRLEYDEDDEDEDCSDEGTDKIQDVKSNTDKVSISSRLRRKPPPGEEFKMYLNDKSRETVSSGSYSLNPTDLYSLTDDQELQEMLPIVSIPSDSNKTFPQFPDIKHHHHHHHHYPHNPLFKIKRNSFRLSSDSYAGTMDLSFNGNNDEYEGGVMAVEDPSSNGPLRSSTPLIGQQQTVQFRSTMRKTKRKDKKFMFDELKPWKNHNELNYLTDQEKKRYEGVWVSNKGNYMKNVMIKLNGVNYDTSKEIQQQQQVQEIGTLEHSRTAAKLSAIPIGDNHNSLHNLDSVEIEQLICGSVVKRIWKRSRLPNDILEQIWNLVDFRRDGTLNRNEFLVGMWLVDQCLYGRKLPKQVDKAVWDSLGGIGVNVNVIKKKK